MTSERAQQGATFGALAGAAAGLLSGADDGNDRLRNTAAGAAVGALIGGATGAFLEAQARELRGTLGNGIEVIEQGEQLIVRMPQDLLFATDSAQVAPTLREDVPREWCRVGRILKEWLTPSDPCGAKGRAVVRS